MPLSSAEQQIIEDMIAAASPDQRDNMRLDAEAALRRINNLMARRLLSQEETKVAERAIEILVRLEAIGTGKAAPQPFSALVKNEVNDDAVKLKTLTNLAAAKYLPMADEELKAALPLDFPHYGFEFDSATFVFAWGEENTRASNVLCPVIDGLGNALRATGLSSPQQAKQKNSLS